MVWQAACAWHKAGEASELLGILTPYYMPIGAFWCLAGMCAPAVQDKSARHGSWLSALSGSYRAQAGNWRVQHWQQRRLAAARDWQLIGAFASARLFPGVQKLVWFLVAGCTQ